MIKLWLANVAPEASDDDIKALIKTYAPDLDCTDVQREAGDGSRPAAIVACLALSGMRSTRPARA